MDPEYMWDLTYIFRSKEEWEKALEEAKAETDKIASVCENFTENADSLKRGLDFIYSAAHKTELVYLYAFLHKSGDNGDPDFQDAP